MVTVPPVIVRFNHHVGFRRSGAAPASSRKADGKKERKAYDRSHSLERIEGGIMSIIKQKRVVRAWQARGFSMILLASGLFLMAAAPAAAQPTQITLLHINDTHSHLAAWGPKDGNLDGTLGGIAKAAWLVAMERAADPNALFVDAGDVMDGDFFFNEYLGVDEFQLLRSIGLDAMVPGNHEWRFGPEFLAGVLQSAWGTPAAGAAILGTNLQIPAGNPLLPWVTPTLIKNVNGVKVGFFGLSSKSAPANPAPAKVVKITYPLVQAAVDSLRGAGAPVVVCLSHNGMPVAQDMAANVSGIDVIVNGHDNAVTEQPEAVSRLGGGTTFIVSAGHLYRYVGRLRLSVEGSVVSLVDYALLSADADTPSLPAVQTAVEALKAGIVARYGDVYHLPLAWADQEITLAWPAHGAKRDTLLGNLFTDAYRSRTGTDIALEAFAYMGDPLPEGTVVGADVFRAMSYGNLAVVDGKQIAWPWRLVTFRMTESALIGVLEFLLSLPPDPYFPQVSGLRFDYNSSADPGERILLDTVHVNGHPYVADRLCSVTVTEGIFAALGLPVQYETLPDTAFDAVRSLVAQRGELGLATSNRIRDIAAIPGKAALRAPEQMDLR
jgi:5'-nucleotidase / UDP-sugar diphosphatase